MQLIAILLIWLLLTAIANKDIVTTKKGNVTMFRGRDRITQIKDKDFYL